MTVWEPIQDYRLREPTLVDAILSFACLMYGASRVVKSVSCLTSRTQSPDPLFHKMMSQRLTKQSPVSMSL